MSECLWAFLIILGLLGLYWIILLPLANIFEKAGQKKGNAFIPYYNAFVLARVAKINPWWSLLFLTPIGPYLYIVLVIKLSSAFGKGTGFVILSLLFPWLSYLMLAYSDCRYRF